MARNNVYQHAVDLKDLKIQNCEPGGFAVKVAKLPYLGYAVEKFSDGRKIVIAKPGGKRSFGQLKREDFFVFIYNPEEGTLWQISHKQLQDDLKEKCEQDKEEGVKILRALQEVYVGREPDEVLNQSPLKNSGGEEPEALLKAYKWIWAQEDVNYPPPKFKGRAMSWEGWTKEKGKYIQTGDGLNDLLEKYSKEP
jgi:hypothetical protein